MRKINYYSGVLSLLVVCFFTSCTSTKYGAHFQPSHHGPSNYSTADNTRNADSPALAFEEEKVDEVVDAAALRSGAGETNTDVLPKAVTLKKLITEARTVDKKELSQRQQQILAETKERLNNMSRKEKRQLRKEIRKLSLAEHTKDLPVYENMGIQQDVTREVNVLALILALLIPPLGVFVHQGEINDKFWISLILTLLFFVPGVVYSVLVVLGIV